MTQPLTREEIAALLEGITPGEWSCGDTFTIRGPHPKGGGRSRIVARVVWDKGTHRRETEANAAIITNAPRLARQLLALTEQDANQDNVVEHAHHLALQKYGGASHRSYERAAYMDGYKAARQLLAEMDARQAAEREREWRR